jgi:hypothetical protein
MKTFVLLFPICFVIALTWAALKEDEPEAIAKTAVYYFGTLAGGICVLAVVLTLVSHFIQPGL